MSRAHMAQLKAAAESFHYPRFPAANNLEEAAGEYEVQDILEKKNSSYKVLWSTGELTWEPLKNLANCKELLAKLQQAEQQATPEEEPTEEESEVLTKRTEQSKETRQRTSMKNLLFHLATMASKVIPPGLHGFVV